MNTTRDVSLAVPLSTMDWAGCAADGAASDAACCIRRSHGP